MRVAVVAVVIIVVVIVVVAFLVPTSLQKSTFIDLRNNTYRFIKKKLLASKMYSKTNYSEKNGLRFEENEWGLENQKQCTQTASDKVLSFCVKKTLKKKATDLQMSSLQQQFW